MGLAGGLPKVAVGCPGGCASPCLQNHSPRAHRPLGEKTRLSASATGLEHSAHVLEKGGKVFSATLGLVDIVKGTNSYYKLQLLEDDKESRCVLGTGQSCCEVAP